MPCYNGQIHETCFTSCMKLFHELTRRGIEYTVMTNVKESLITRARNTAVAHLLGDKRFTHLMFIDSDLGFESSAFFRLLDCNKPVVGGVYPQKSINMDKLYQTGLQYLLKATTASSQPLTTDRWVAKALTYNYNMLKPSGKLSEFGYEAESGFIRCKHVPTGFMLIQRQTLELLAQRSPEMRYTVHAVPGMSEEVRRCFYTFFDTMIDPITKEYLSEDYAFCLRVQDAGLEVWMDLFTGFTHTGNHTFSGHPFESLGEYGDVIHYHYTKWLLHQSSTTAA